MVDDVVFQKLMDVSFRLVSFRPRSEKELRDGLITACKKRHIEDPEVIPKVLSRLKELGYVDDEKFGAWWIDQRNQFRPKGWRAISFELQQKGLSRAVIETLRDKRGIEDATREEENATRLAAKVLKRYGSLSPKDLKVKLYTYLSQRGFDGNLVSRVVDVTLKKGYNKD
jgi:regulatory protein